MWSNVVKCNLSLVKRETMLISSLPVLVMRSGVGSAGVLLFLQRGFEVNPFSRTFVLFDFA